MILLSVSSKLELHSELSLRVAKLPYTFRYACVYQLSLSLVRLMGLYDIRPRLFVVTYLLCLCCIVDSAYVYKLSW